MKKQRNVWCKALDQKGFTLIECIFTLLITGIILTFVPLTIKTFDHIDHSLSPEETYEWNLFVIQLRKELRISDKWEIENNKLVLNINSESVVYEKYGNSMRRRVNNKGHEVVLRKVNSMSFNKKQNNISVSILFLNNHIKDANFFLNEKSVTALLNDDERG